MRDKIWISIAGVFALIWAFGYVQTRKKERSLGGIRFESAPMFEKRFCYVMLGTGFFLLLAGLSEYFIGRVGGWYVLIGLGSIMNGWTSLKPQLSVYERGLQDSYGFFKFDQVSQYSFGPKGLQLTVSRKEKSRTFNLKISAFECAELKPLLEQYLPGKEAPGSEMPIPSSPSPTTIPAWVFVSTVVGVVVALAAATWYLHNN